MPGRSRRPHSRLPYRKQPRKLLVETSPYGSGQLVVEADADVSAAYLLDQYGRVRASLWLANHHAAPTGLDQDRMADGMLPPMPAMHTKSQEGRPPPRPRSLEVVWFEEGDGAALLERGDPLGVIPGWVEADLGIPGYSQLAAGRTPLAWPLDEARHTVVPRVKQASAFWRWRGSKDGWERYQGDALTHLEQRLGPVRRYWSDEDSRLPRLGIAEHPPTPGRPFAVTSTVGMGCQRMPGVERYDPPPPARIEVAIATSRPYEPVADLLSWLGAYPWRHRTSLATGHAARWPGHAGRFPLSSLGNWGDSVLTFEHPNVLLGLSAPDLTGLTVSGEPVRWLWAVPINAKESRFAAEHGTHALVESLALDGHDWVARV